MGPNDQNHTAHSGKTLFSFARRVKNRPAPFVFQWRALQRELTFKTTQLERFSSGISEIVAAPRRLSRKPTGAVSRFEKSFLSNSIAS
jgi:hypothetical protein